MLPLPTKFTFDIENLLMICTVNLSAQELTFDLYKPYNTLYVMYIHVGMPLPLDRKDTYAKLLCTFSNVTPQSHRTAQRDI